MTRRPPASPASHSSSAPVQTLVTQLQRCAAIYTTSMHLVPPEFRDRATVVVNGVDVEHLQISLLDLASGRVVLEVELIDGLQADEAGFLDAPPEKNRQNHSFLRGLPD